MTRKRLKLLVIHELRSYFDEIRELVDMNDHLYEVEYEYTDSGQKAISLMREWQPTVVLLDAHISDANYCELLERFKHEAAPVIVISAHSSKEIEESALKSGAAGYCPASSDPDVLDYIIHQLAVFAADSDSVH